MVLLPVLLKVISLHYSVAKKVFRYSSGLLRKRLLASTDLDIYMFYVSIYTHIYLYNIMNHFSGRELRQTLVCLAPELRQHLCPVPFCCGPRVILQGTAKSLCVSPCQHIGAVENKLPKVSLCALQRCMYASCNCEKSENCLCAVFSSYARACSSKGVFLLGWRDNVCRKDFNLNIP